MQPCIIRLEDKSQGGDRTDRKVKDVGENLRTLISKVSLVEDGCGGVCLQSQYLGGRGSRVCLFEVTLDYVASSRIVRAK